MRRGSAILSLLLLLACCFSLATLLQPRAIEWNRRAQSGGVLKVMFGEGRRLFANQFFKEADIYFHSGFYPSIFDEAKAASSEHLTEGADPEGKKEEKCDMDFMRPPRDWVEAFGRHFVITEHTHLARGKEREILPWLRLSADLDPQRVETYTVAAYWLSSMGRVKEAEDFLREGLRNNAESYEILTDLARLYEKNRGDLPRARNLYARALECWQQQEPGKKEPDRVGYEKIVFRLARLEEKTGHISAAIEHYEMAAKVSPNPVEIRKTIEELRARLKDGQ
jgi:tetratricopeptide (TPR) repeat protein